VLKWLTAEGTFERTYKSFFHSRSVHGREIVLAGAISLA
jgi:hypothetical protein